MSKRPPTADQLAVVVSGRAWESGVKGEALAVAFSGAE